MMMIHEGWFGEAAPGKDGRRTLRRGSAQLDIAAARGRKLVTEYETLERMVLRRCQADAEALASCGAPCPPSYGQCGPHPQNF